MKKTLILSIALILAPELFADIKEEAKPELNPALTLFIENDFRFSAHLIFT